MKRQLEVYYKAAKNRDPKYDGRIFVGVKTTGIYCRPICPARPKKENIKFFPTAKAAEAAGYRPCLRCRPESAPNSPAWHGKKATVQRALKLIDKCEMADLSENDFSKKLGISARHLRRLFSEELGQTPKQLWMEKRLNESKKLVVETELSITEIAYKVGFRSLRRFNDAFKNKFKFSPSRLRSQP